VTFIETIDEADAEGTTADWYAAERDRVGYLPNYAKVFGHRPEVYAAWKQLGGAVGAMDARRYELATLAAAKVLRSSYCALAHGKILAERFLGPDRTRALADGAADQVLDEADAEVVRFATQVARDAASVTARDVDRLRAVGLSDEEILDVTLAVAARCFFSTVLEALGTQPDPAFRALDPALRDALTVGRPIAEG
jgi:uncharacterized peroxidase-related enzyme